MIKQDFRLLIRDLILVYRSHLKTRLRLMLFVCAGFGIAFSFGCDEKDRLMSLASTTRAAGQSDKVSSILVREPAVKDISPWGNEFGEGMVIRTDHYEIYTTLLEPLMLRKVPGFMESAYRGYCGIITSKVRTTEPMKVYLFATRQQWEDFGKGFTGDRWPMYQKIRHGAYYLNGACVAYNIGRTRTFSVLGHEGWHQFCNRHFAYRLPSWADEGLAMQFEAYDRDGGWFKFDTKRNLPRMGGLRLAMQNNQLIGLRDLVGMNPGEVVSSEDHSSVTGYYSQVYTLVRFLREYNYGVYREKFEKMLSDGLDGKWPLNEQARRIVSDRNVALTVYWNKQFSPRLFAHYISGDFGKMEKEYLNFCVKIARQVRVKKRNTAAGGQN